MDRSELKAANLDEEEIERIRQVEKALNAGRSKNRDAGEIYLLAVTRNNSGDQS